MPVPDPVYLGKPTQQYPWPFVGYRYLEGQPAWSRELSEAETLRLARIRALNHILALMLNAVDKGDERLRAETLQSLRRIAE